MPIDERYKDDGSITRGASIAAPDANSSALTCGAAAQLPAEPVSQSAPATPAPRATRIAPPAAPPTQRCV